MGWQAPGVVPTGLYTDAKGEKRKKPLSPFTMPFTGEEVEHRLNMVAVFPVLAAFRLLIKKTEDSFEWVSNFEEVKALWDAIAVEVMDTTKDDCATTGYVLNALGKSRPHWDSVQRIVENAVFKQENDAMRQKLEDMIQASKSRP